MLRTQLHLGGQDLPAAYRPVVPDQGLVVLTNTRSGPATCPCLGHLPGVLGAYGLATLRVDLPGPAEAGDLALERDLDRLVDAVVLLIHALRAGLVIDQGLALAPPRALALIGADLGGAVALHAAARVPDAVTAVVGCGTRVDLAQPVLARLRVPTLLVVAERDTAALQAHRQARRELHGLHRLEVVPGATAGFPEPGALDTVAHQVATWLRDHFPASVAG